MSWVDILTDPTRIGLMVLMALGAMMAGKLVYNRVPKHRNPLFWGSVAAFLIIGVLAYIGIPEAGIVLWVFIAIAVIMGISALVL